MSKAWQLELPGDGHLIMAVRPRLSLGKVKLDFTFDNAAEGGEEREVMLEVRGQHGQILVMHVCWRGSRIATVRRIFDDGGKGASWLFKQEHEVDVAEGGGYGIGELLVCSNRRGRVPRMLMIGILDCCHCNYHGQYHSVKVGHEAH